MRTTSAACLSLLALVASRPATAADDWEKIQLQLTKVAGTVYMIDMVEGSGGFAGGNVGVSIGADGIVLVDTMFAPLAPKVMAALRSVSDQPVRFVINTHVHGDHTDGNAAFGAGAIIVAHANTRLQLATDGPDPEDRAAPAIALPVITIGDELSLHQNGESIRVVHFPHAHSDTDAVVFFEQSKVVHMGDTYFAGMFPFIGRGGSIAGLVACIEKVLSDAPADAKVIPGHGPLSNLAELRATLAMLQETSAIVENGIKNKQSLQEMTAAKVLAKYDKWGGGYLSTDGWLEQLYAVLTRS